MLAIVESLGDGFQDVYVNTDMDLGRVTGLFHSPPKAILLNSSIFISLAHMHNVNWDSTGKSIVGVNHR